MDDELEQRLNELITEFRVHNAVAQHIDERLDEYCKKNDADHQEIFRRLDVLNGWRNKLTGVLAFLAVMTPVGAAIYVAYA